MMRLGLSLLLTSLFILLPISCKKAEPIAWEASQVVGLEITLQDDERVEYLDFRNGGILAITLGTKEFITGPVYKWKIAAGRLTITTMNDEFYEELTLFSLSRDQLVAQRKSGEMAQYTVHNLGVK